MIRKKIRVYDNRKMKAQSRGITLDGYARLTIPFAVAAIAFGLLTYVALTSITVWNTADRTSKEKDIRALSSSVSDLESKISGLSSGITKSLAYEKGFKEPQKIKYLNADSLTSALSSNEMDI